MVKTRWRRIVLAGLAILAIGGLSGPAASYNFNPATRVEAAQTDAQTQTTKLVVHYRPKTGDTVERGVYVWAGGLDGKWYKFTGTDKFGKVAALDLAGNYAKTNFIVTTEDWNKDGGDRTVTSAGGLGEAWVEGGNDTTLTAPPAGFEAQYQSVHVKIHYYRDDQQYTGWNVWQWSNDKNGAAAEFNGDDSFGKVAEFTVKSETPFSQVGVIIRKSTADQEKDGDADRILKNGLIKDNGDGTGSAEIWLTSGDPTLYLSPTLIDKENRIKSATIDTMNTIKVTVNKVFDPAKIKDGIKLSQGTIADVTTTKDAPTVLTITTKEAIDLKTPLTVTLPGYGDAMASIGAVVRTDAFDQAFAFNGQLGALYTDAETTFRLWAPTAAKVDLVTYQGTAADSPVKATVPLTPGEKGTWSAQLPGKQSGTVYTYHLTFPDGTTSDAADPYATAAIVNGGRSVVLAPSEMVPANWGGRMAPFSRPTDAVIDEMQIRDFSIAPNSGIQNKGKYLGVIETGTKTTKGTVSGLDHLKAMGVTHVQIMPMYDFASVDESKPDTPQYNWGYDPENYNVPEGSFSSDATNPQTRILEAKEMIQGLHNNGLRVIMDVVYNHVDDPGKQAFQQTVPGYYFRYDKNGKLANGTGVGNDVASDRAMARKYIVDSVTYWAKNYHIDGFRFDLMGILDTETMKEVRAALDQIDPSIITLGEGWDLNTPLAADRKANQKNANQLPAVAFFNDSMRDAIKGSVFEAADPGFVNGKTGVESLLAKNILGGQDLTADLGTTYVAPTQLIQYAEAHDNLTLYDKLVKTNPDDTDAVRAKRDMLANSIVLLSQGVPFMQNGQEFLRTKDGDENSYKSPDAINQIDWDRAATYAPAVNYMKGLIALRKATPALRYTSYADIKANTKLLQAQDRVVAYQAVAGDKATTIIFNANEKDTPVKLANGTYAILVKDDQVDTRGSKSLTISNGEVNVPALSTLVLQQTATTPGGGTSGGNTGGSGSNGGSDNGDNSSKPETVKVEKKRGVLTLHSAGVVKTSYDADGKIVARDPLPAGSRWQIFAVATYPNGDTWYHLGGNQWVKANDGVLSTNQDKAQVGVINYVPGYGVAVWTKPGAKLVPKVKLAHNTAWRVFGKTTYKGQTWYHLGGDQWVSAEHMILVGEQRATKGVTRVLGNTTAQVFDGPGTTGQKRMLPAGSAWIVGTIGAAQNQLWYKVGTGQWIQAGKTSGIR